MPLMPAERAIRRARATIANEHRRRNARGAQAASPRRMIAIDQGGGKRRGGVIWVGCCGYDAKSWKFPCKFRLTGGIGVRDCLKDRLQIERIPRQPSGHARADRGT